MLTAVLILIGCQLIGEVIRAALALPIPGPVIGMFLLAAVLATVLARRSSKPDQGDLLASLEKTAETLIAHMGLLFVPAGVGVIAEAGLLRREWLPIVAAVAGSTILSVAVTGLVMHWITRPSRRPKGAAPLHQGGRP